MRGFGTIMSRIWVWIATTFVTETVFTASITSVEVIFCALACALVEKVHFFGRT